MKLPRRRLELGFINISVLSWLCFGNLKQKLLLWRQRDLIQHIMSFCCFIFGFFFLAKLQNVLRFTRTYGFLVLNHNHVICIPSPLFTHTHTHTHTQRESLLRAQKVPALFFCTVGQPNAQSFQASLHLCTNYKRACGWSGEAKMLGKLSVPGRPTNLDNNRAKGLLRL